METPVQHITINPAVCSGKPAIRNMRFTVAQLLELLASGMTQDEILGDYPFLTEADIKACLQYAAMIANTRTITPLNAA